MAIRCQLFGTSKDPPLRCPDRPARNYHYTLCYIPKEHRSKEGLLLSIKVNGNSAKLLNFTVHTARWGHSFFMICRKVNMASLLVDIRCGLITPELQLRHATILQVTSMDRYLQEEFICLRKDMHFSIFLFVCRLIIFNQTPLIKVHCLRK
jgi:hypothetical protein